ncbi:DNA adenine methylase [Chitinophaga japonensis]|uniref:site-specific DNA-methyltransferase (adenine-specific) n=1 Tax=Chitinophaga japonensis TaxID=104662 RepID=A0A562T7K6_CHIJA|nr:DNA adenine methylase [Chitinophaga japonensis]TWI89283.1 DNA adenine methylase [Chitinophaga japonensis]
MEKKVNTNYYSPLRYPGGKNCIFSFVSKLFYENNFIGCSYAEPYAGGAGLALRLLFEGYVNHVYINDLDRSIYSFWLTILNRPEEFCEWISEVEITMKNWHKYKEFQKTAYELDEFELAKSTFFLNRTNVSGVIKGGVIGGQNQTGKYKIDARFNKQDLIERIKRIAELRDRITLTCMDGLTFINKMNRINEEVFIYLDPPYYQKGADLYMNFYSNSDHQKLSRQVLKMKKKWMVSYDNHDFILNLYAQERKILYKLSQAASNRVGDEIIVFSKEINFTESVKALKSPVILNQI